MNTEILRNCAEDADTAFMLTRELMAHHNALDIFTTTKERLAELRRDWGDVEETLGLKHHEDDLAEAMSCHIRREIEKLREHIEKM